MVLSQSTNTIIDPDSPNNVSVMPGQSFELRITILYEDQQPEPVIVTSDVVKW